MNNKLLVTKVDALKKSMTVEAACKKAGLNVSTYYYYKKGGVKSVAKTIGKAEKPGRSKAIQPTLNAERGSILMFVIPPDQAKNVFMTLAGMIG